MDRTVHLVLISQLTMEGECGMGARLENKTALVTGATSNIGRAIAIAFAAEGAHVVASGRSQEPGAEVIAEIPAPAGRGHFFSPPLYASPHPPPTPPPQ